MMLTNRQIRNKELFKASQRLMQINSDLKKVQNDVLLAMNDCFACEYYNASSLKKGIKKLEMQKAIKRYSKIYAQKLACQETLDKLRSWKPSEEEGDR